MALLPSEMFVIQQSGGIVRVFAVGSEWELVRFDPSDANATAKAQDVIAHTDRLSEEDRCFAHFWSGYFYAHAKGL